MATVTFESKNRQTAKQLVINQNAPLEFVKNPNNGNLFFVCGNIKGLVSPAAKKVYNTCSLDDLQFADVTIINDGVASEEPIPMLMTVGNSKQNVMRSLGADLLH